MAKEQQQKTNNKLTDKAFVRLMVTSFLGIAICLASLCSATWAWFTTATESTENTLGSGTYALDIECSKVYNGLNSESTAVSVEKRSDGTAVCTVGAGTYTVTVRLDGNATVKTGFCVVKLGARSYKTTAICDGDTFTFSFVAPGDVTLEFVPTWGIPAESELVLGATLDIASGNVTIN